MLLIVDQIVDLNQLEHLALVVEWLLMNFVIGRLLPQPQKVRPQQAWGDFDWERDDTDPDIIAHIIEKWPATGRHALGRVLLIAVNCSNEMSALKGQGACRRLLGLGV
jgi:hypothetical protein